MGAVAGVAAVTAAGVTETRAGWRILRVFHASFTEAVGQADMAHAMRTRDYEFPRVERGRRGVTAMGDLMLFPHCFTGRFGVSGRGERDTP